jgi:hypothetical protein
MDSHYVKSHSLSSIVTCVTLYVSNDEEKYKWRAETAAVPLYVPRLSWKASHSTDVVNKWGILV